MTQDDGNKPDGAVKSGRKPSREERIKAALRANLQRRKQKSRALKAQERAADGDNQAD